MTQIVNARFYRLGVNRSWESSWAVSKLLYTPYVTHDLILFKYIKLFISQYSAPLYFKFPHKDTQEISDNNSENVLNKITSKKGQDIEIKNEKLQIEWHKKILKIKTCKTVNPLEIWLKKRRQYRINFRLNDCYTKIKKINLKKQQNILEKSNKKVDISPQPPLETLAANPRKLSGNDRIIHNPFTKIGLIFSHLNVLRQKALILKIFISDYETFDKMNILSKKYLKRKISKKLKILFRRKLRKNIYATVKKYRKKNIIDSKLNNSLNFYTKRQKFSVKIQKDVLTIKPTNPYKHSRFLLRRKTIRKMIPRRIRGFMNNRLKFFVGTNKIKYSLLSAENLQNINFLQNKARFTTTTNFYQFIRRFVILTNFKRYNKCNFKTIPLMRKFLKPILSLSSNKSLLRSKIYNQKTSKFLDKIKNFKKKHKFGSKLRNDSNKNKPKIFKTKQTWQKY